jgi:hypothetical protein
MSAEGIVRHELARDLAGQDRIEPASDIEGRQVPMFGLNVCGEAGSFQVKVGTLHIRLRTNRDIFAGRHHGGTGDKAGETSEQHLASREVARLRPTPSPTTDWISRSVRRRRQAWLRGAIRCDVPGNDVRRHERSPFHRHKSRWLN